MAEDDTGADAMAEVEDGTAGATEEDAAASADVEASEDDAGADTMAEVDDGTAPATEEDAAASADVEPADDDGHRHRHHGGGRRRHRGRHRARYRKMQRLRLTCRGTEDDAGADTMAEADDGTAPATEEDAAAAPDAEAAEDEAGTDTMAEADDGTAPATEEDAAATPEAEASEDDAGADAMAEVDDGTAPATGDMQRLRLMWRRGRHAMAGRRRHEEDASASADRRYGDEAPTPRRRPTTAPRPLPRKMRRLRLTCR